jgi:hypothetical protein
MIGGKSFCVIYLIMLYICVYCMFQYEVVHKVVKLLSKQLLVEQAGKSTVENSLVVIVLSLAMVSTLCYVILVILIIT